MGNNVNITIMTDTLDQIEKNPEEFVSELCNKIRGYSSISVTDDRDIPAGNSCRAARVNMLHHSHDYAVIVEGGNTADMLGFVFHVDPHSEEGKRDIIRKLAIEYGLELKE